MRLEMEFSGNVLDFELDIPVMHVNEEWLEISYYQSGPEGWGAGGDEYITKSDLRTIADGFRSVLNGDTEEFSYSCGVVENFYEEYKKPVIKLSVTAERVVFSMIETLERQSYITIEDNNVQKFADAFFAWENDLY